MGLKEFFRTTLSLRLDGLFARRQGRDEILAEIEEQLILSDISLEVAAKVVAGLAKRLPASASKEDVLAGLREDFLAILSKPIREEKPPEAKEVVMLVGVNGSGKTTSAAKLAWWHGRQGRRVLLCAADTFRAAGASQLDLWGRRLGFAVESGERGADPGAVVYRGLERLTGGAFDLMIVDTAGRVQSKEHLLRELEKAVKIVRRALPTQPRQTLLVLDAGTGHNALIQAEKFGRFSGVDGLFLSKMDGTAKGGTVLAISDRLGIPVRYLGVGEGAEDLLEFSAADFVAALVGG